MYKYIIFYLIFGCPVVSAYSATINFNPGWPGDDLNGVPCPESKRGKNPQDYTDPRWHSKVITQANNYLYLVETRHFTDDVRHLRSGSTGIIYGDLLYTLSKFPNHHPALFSISQYHLRKLYNSESGGIKAIGDSYIKPECFFNRALAFKYEDPLTHMVFGIYLSKLKMYKKALEHYLISYDIDNTNVELFYNMGLLYFDLKDFSKSKQFAEMAYGNGFQLMGLKNKLSVKGIIDVKK